MEAYNRAMNLESEQKTKKKKSSSSDLDDNASSQKESSNDEMGSKKVRALQKDMIRMMKEFKNMHKETKGNELWCIECKKEGHTKGSCPKDQFCEICQIMGHSTKECLFNLKTRGPQWCGLGDHEDAKCPKSGVDLITIGIDEEEVLAITWKQVKVYLDAIEEKKRLEDAQAEIQKATQAEKEHLKDTIGTSTRNCVEQNIVRQILQTEVLVKINDLLLTMPQLHTALPNIAPTAGERRWRKCRRFDAASPLIRMTSGSRRNGNSRDYFDRHDCGRRVRCQSVTRGHLERLGQSMLWPRTFQLLTADQHGIKPLGVLMAQLVMIGTQPFLLDFIMILLKRKGYNAILGRGWLIQAKVKHD